MTDRTPASGPAALRYWTQKATDYPRHGSSGAADGATALRAAAAGLGARWAGRHVLDVGAGTGLHAIPFAAEGAQVVATDLAPAMLAPLSAHRGIATVAGDFLALDLSALGWIEAFDLVWACMTPVLGETDGLRRLEAASRDQVAAVAWGPDRRDPLIEGAFALHGVTFAPPGWHRVVDAHLAATGRRARRLVRPWNMIRQTPVADVLADLEAHLGWLGVTPDTERLAAWCAERAQDGLIPRKVAAEQIIWVWSVL